MAEDADIPAFDDLPSFDEMPEAPTQPQASAASEPARPLRFDDIPAFDDIPEAEGPLKTFGREAAHSTVPAAGGLLAGAAAGAAAGTLGAGPIGTIGGAIVGGLAGAYATEKVQEKALDTMGFDDSQQRAANIEANPKSAFAGQMAPALATMRPDRAASVAQRGVSAGLMGGVGAVQELYNEGTVSPGKVAAAAVAGAVLPTPNRVGAKIIGAGEAVGNRVAAAVPGRPNKPADPAAVPEQAETQRANDQPIVTGENALEQPPPAVQGDTVGNPDSAPSRSERQYGKGKGPSGEAPDMLTQGEFSPDVAAALQASLDEHAVTDTSPLPEIPGHTENTPEQRPDYTGTQRVDTGLEEAAAAAPAQEATVPVVAPAGPPAAQAAIAKSKGRDQEDHPAAKIAEAAKETNTEPSAAQIEADNYKKGGGRLFGREVKIENAKGSIRRSKPGFEPKWEVEVPYDYGDIKGTKGADGDNIDIAVVGTGDRHFVIDQRNPDTGKFDEHKVFAHAEDASDAIDHYVRGFSDDKGLDRLGSIKEVSAQELKDWLGKPGAKKKPFDPEFKDVAGASEGEKPEPKVVTAAVTKLRESGNEAAIEKLRAMEPSEQIGWASKYVNGTTKELTRPNRIRGEAPKVEGLVNDQGEPVTARSKGDAAAKSADVKTMNDAYEAHAPQEPKLPETPEEKAALREAAQKFLDDTAGVKYRPNFKHAPYLFARAAKKLTAAKNPSDKAWQEFTEVLHQLRGGNDADVRQGQRIEADIGRNRRSGDDAIAGAEARNAQHENVEDAMIEAIDRRREFKGDIPHEEMESVVKPEKVETAADIKRLEKTQGSVDITTKEGRGKLKDDTAQLADNLIKTAERKAPEKTEDKPASAVRKIDPGGVDKAAIMAALEKATAKNKNADHAVREEELGTRDEPRPRNALKSFWDDQGGKLDLKKISQDFRALGRPIWRDFMHKTFGRLYTDNQRLIDSILAQSRSEQSARQAEKAHTLFEARYYQWLEATPKESLDYLKAMEKIPSGTSVPMARGKLVSAGLSTEKAMWMADEALEHRAFYDRMFQEDTKRGIDVNYNDGYVAHIFKKDKVNGMDAAQWLKHTIGPRWYTKDRLFDSLAQAQAAGYKLKYTNPIELLNARWDASLRSNLILDAARALERNGFAVEAENASPYQKRNWTFGRNLPNKKEWLFAPDAQHLWMNSIEAAGLEENRGIAGTVFHAFNGFKNIAVPVQLMLGAFHEVHIIANVMVAQELTDAFKRAVTGGIASAPKSYAKAFANVAKDGVFALPLDKLPLGIGKFLDRNNAFSGYEGRRVMDAWHTPDAQLSPYDRLWKGLAKEAGFQPTQPHEEVVGAKRQLAKALYDFKNETGLDQLKAGGGVLWQGFRRGMEKIQEPMFKYQIPALKAAAFKRSVATAMQADPRIINDAGLRRQVLREIGKNIDDRFGEMFYGGLFWNKALKDVGRVTMVSMPWNLGQVRQAGGAIEESFARMQDLFGKQRSDVERARIASDKLAYVTHYVGLSMLSAGAITYMNTGEFPSELMDYIYPKNGLKNRDGSAQRLSTPFNTREPVMLKAHADEHNSWIGGAAQLLWNKMILQPFTDLASNRDFFGRQMYDPNASFIKRNAQAVDSMLERVLNPIVISGSDRAKELGGGRKEQALAWLGFGPAPKYVNETPLQRRINKILGEESGVRGYEYGEKTGLGRGLVQGAIRKLEGDQLPSELRREGRNEADIKKMVQSGLSPRYAAHIAAAPHNEYQSKFARLQPQDQRTLAGRMDDEEFKHYVIQNRERGLSVKVRVQLIKERNQQSVNP